MREALGLQLKGTSYEGRYVIVDIELKSDRPTERLAWFDPPSNPGSTVLMHKQPDDIWRIDYQLRDGEDPEEAVKPENVIPRVQSHLEMMGETGDWAPVWITIYKANALTLESYRHGRVLFAGDAAHLVPIFGVRGANSGIDDADNLAWKLAFVVKGLASDGLARQLLAGARVRRPREPELRHQEHRVHGAAVVRLRADAARRRSSLAVKHAGLRSLINPRQTSAITYVYAPPLNSLGLQAAPAEFQDRATVRQYPAGMPGQPYVEDGEVGAAYLTDLVDSPVHGLLFHRGGTVPAPDGKDLGCRACPGVSVQFKLIPLTQRLASDLPGVTAWDHTGRLFDLYGAQPGSLYLVRPDGHVLGRWHTAEPAEVAGRP